MKKKKNYGIRGVAHKWLSSYINDRKQYASFDCTDSNLLDIKRGVPQGSIVGPILFILYINDLCNVSMILKYVLFADDTNLFAPGTDMVKLCKQINEELLKINKWFIINDLH